MVAQDQGLVRSTENGYAHTALWTAPEISNGQETYSKEADVFSFALHSLASLDITAFFVS